MARDSTRIGQFGFWRRWVAGMAFVALILHGLSLFAPHARLSAAQAALAVLADLPGAESAGTILCLNASDDDFSGKTPVHGHDSGACPMCQIVGFSLAGASGVSALVTPAPSVSGAPAILLREIAPRAPPRIAARPRGPPILV